MKAIWNALCDRRATLSAAAGVAGLCFAAVAGAAATISGGDAGAASAPVKIHHTTDWYKAHPLTKTGIGAGTQASQGAGTLSYHNGPVMLTNNTYAIYWAPSGHAISSSYQTLLNRYFADVGGTSFFNILTQYSQTPGPAFIQNQSVFVGSYVDTTPYPHTGAPSDPLQDSDIQDEVRRAIAANGWPVGQNNMYFVFTAQGIESCNGATSCTPGTPNPSYCAYHGNLSVNAGTVAYANMPYDETWAASCRGFSTSPNGDIAADSEISTTSHEHFEAVTDVLVSTGPYGWYDRAGYEIGDKCGYQYGTVAADGSNITLHGNKYIVQQEYSNAARNCVLSR